MTGIQAISIYEREIARSDEILTKIDLDAPPVVASGERIRRTTHV